MGIWEALDQRKCILSDMEYLEFVPVAPSMTARSEARSGSEDEISMDAEGSGVGATDERQRSAHEKNINNVCIFSVSLRPLHRSFIVYATIAVTRAM